MYRRFCEDIKAYEALYEKRKRRVFIVELDFKGAIDVNDLVLMLKNIK